MVQLLLIITGDGPPIFSGNPNVHLSLDGIPPGKSSGHDIALNMKKSVAGDIGASTELIVTKKAAQIVLECIRKVGKCAARQDGYTGEKMPDLFSATCSIKPLSG